MVSDADLLDAVRSFIGVENSPVATPGDVADRVDVKRETVRQRLLRLAADDELRTRKVGRSRVFWLPDALAPATEPALQVELTDEPADSPAEEAGGAGSSGAEPTPRADETAPRPEDIDEIVADLEPPGHDPDAVDARRCALDVVIDELRQGPRSKSELLDVVDAEVGTAHYADLESLWANWLIDALRELAKQGVAESPGASRKGWRLVAE